MPAPGDEQTRVYTNEGLNGTDAVSDDKVDLNRIAADIGQPQCEDSDGRENIPINSRLGVKTPVSHTPHLNSATSAAATTVPPQSQANTGFCSSRYRTAFTNFSPSYASQAQAQLWQQIATQQYYGYLANARLYQHFVNSHPPSPLGSPTYLNPQWTPTGVFSAMPAMPMNHWTSPFSGLDQASKTACLGLAGPWLVAPSVHAAQLSPNFLLPVDQLGHPGVGSMPFLNFNSPLPSPDFGVPLAPLGAKVVPPQPPHIPFASLKLSVPNGASQFVAHSYNDQLSQPSLQSCATINHLDAMRQIVPSKPNDNYSAGRAVNSHLAMKDECCTQSLSNTCAKNCSQNACCSTSTSLNNAGRPMTCQQLKDARKHHIKKPLNAFMLYMKQMRQTVMQEADLRERQSAEINKILGKRWHSLTKEEQQKYFDMAKKERLDHLRKYPNWSARDNYAIHKKKKKRKDKTQDNSEAKKCRARFGLNQQDQWCKHCKRKKKCLWFKETDSGPEGIDTSPSAQVSSTSHGEDDNNNNSQLNGQCYPSKSSNPQVTKCLLINVKVDPCGNGAISCGSHSNDRVSPTTLVSSTTPLNDGGSSNAGTVPSFTPPADVRPSTSADDDFSMVADEDYSLEEDSSSDTSSSSSDEEDDDLRVTMTSSDDEKMTVEVPISKT